MKTSCSHAAHDLHLLTNPAIWLCALAAAFTVGTARAANSPDNLQMPANANSMSPRQAYDHDKAYCSSNQVTQARSLCMKEAERAYREARAGKLNTNTVVARSDRGSLSATTNTTSTSGTSMASNGRRARSDRH